MDRECFPGEPWEPTDDALWIASYNGEPAGYAAAKHSQHFPDWAYLSRAGVLPGFRGKGIQRRLIQSRCRWAWRSGLTGAYTYTLDNPASGNALIGCGFRLFSPGITVHEPDERWWVRTWQ